MIDQNTRRPCCSCSPLPWLVVRRIRGAPRNPLGRSARGPGVSLSHSDLGANFMVNASQAALVVLLALF